MKDKIEPHKYPGVIIQKLRNDRGLSQRKLAKMCRPPMDHSLISRLEKGGKCGYTQDTLERIAQVFSVTVQYLFMPEGKRFRY